MSDISLTSAMRANLLQLQKTETLIDRTQQRISTGKKINSALDGPAAFFAAKSLTDRANDLTSLKDSMGQAISTIKAANNAITAITDLVQQAKALANTARQNLGDDDAAVSSRAASATQFNELMTQINDLVEDAGYAGKNLLLGDGAVYDATSASVENVDALTGISSTSATQIGGGTSAYNIDVAVTGEVDATLASIGDVETAIGATDVTETSFTSTGDVTVTVTNSDASATDDTTQITISNADSSYNYYMDDGAYGAATATAAAGSNGSGTAQVSEVTFDLNRDVAAGELFQVVTSSTKAGTETWTYTATSTDTAATALSELTSIINADANYGATRSNGIVTITAVSTGTTSAFTTAVTTHTSNFYLVSEGSVTTAESDLGISSVDVKNASDSDPIALTVASDDVTTTFTVTSTGQTAVNTAQTAADGDSASTQTFYLVDSTESSNMLTALSTTGTAATWSINDLRSDVIRVEVVEDTDNLDITLYYADGTSSTGTTGTISTADQDATVTSWTAVGNATADTTTSITFNNLDAGDIAASGTYTFRPTTVSFSAAGVDAGSAAGTANLDIGTVSFTATGIDAYTTDDGAVATTSDTAGLLQAGTAALVFEDNRQISVTQGSNSFTRAVVPDTGEGTLASGTQNFVLSNGATVNLSVDLNTLAAGTATLAASTTTAAGTANDLEVVFNEGGTSTVTIASAAADTEGLGIASAANSWVDAADIDQAITQLDAALGTLRDVGQTLTSNLSVVTTREEFTTEFVNTLEEGADKWLLADTNKEGANLLILQTRQQLGTVSLSIASQSAQSILRLFG